MCIVHANKQYSVEQKLHYLRDALVGRAATVMDNISPGPEQYLMAWRQLNDFYGNRHLQQQAYISELFTLPRLRSATGAAVRQLIDSVRELVTLLRCTNYPIDPSMEMLVYAILRCFSDDMNRAWRNRRDRSSPTLAFLFHFLEDYARDLDEAQIQPSGSESSARQEPAVQGSSARPNPFSAKSSTRQATNEQCSDAQRSNAVQPQLKNKKKRKRAKVCPACPENHHLQQCPLFQSWTTTARQAKVQDWRICPNCFRADHVLKDCKYGPCRNCAGIVWHNSMLCRARELHLQRDIVNDVPPIPFNELAQVTASTHSKVMHMNGSNAHPRKKRAVVTQQSAVAWPLPGEEMKLCPIDRSVTPPLVSLVQDESWTYEMRQHPLAAPYMPPAPITNGSTIHISLPSPEVVANPHDLPDKRIECISIVQALHAKPGTSECENAADVEMPQRPSRPAKTMQPQAESAASPVQMQAEQSDVSRSTALVDDCVALSDASAGIVPPAEIVSESNASSSTSDLAETAPCLPMAASPSDLDFENFLLRTPEYEEFGERASDFPVLGENVPPPEVAMELDTHDELAQHEHPANKSSKRRSSSKKQKHR